MGLNQGIGRGAAGCVGGDGLLGPDVDTGADVAAGGGGEEFGEVHEGGAAGEDDHAAWLHEGELLFSDLAGVFARDGREEKHDAGAREAFVERGRNYVLLAENGRMNPRIVDEDFAGERPQQRQQGAAGIAEADDGERFAREEK